MMPLFEPYGHAVTALALVGLMALAMGPVVGRKKGMLGLPPGAEPPADYASPVYRWHRAYLNLIESIAVFAAVTLAAILAGAAPFWVNLLATLFVLGRIAVAVVHVSGVGRADMGLRSVAFGLGYLCCLGLGLLALAGVFFGA